jgi:hypothetical protein
MLCNQYKKLLIYSESLFATLKVTDMAKVSDSFLNGKEQQTIGSDKSDLRNGNKNSIKKSQNNEEYELKSLLKSNGSTATNDESKSYSLESPKRSKKG